MASAKERPVYWPVDVMCGCMAALDQGSLTSDDLAVVLAVYAVASAARDGADRKIPVPECLQGYIVEA